MNLDVLVDGRGLRLAAKYTFLGFPSEIVVVSEMGCIVLDKVSDTGHFLTDIGGRTLV